MNIKDLINCWPSPQPDFIRATSDDSSCDYSFTPPQSFTPSPPSNAFDFNQQSSKKLFQCNLCGQTYGRFHDLSRHRKSHSGIKDVICNQCGSGFSRKDALRRHQQADNGSVCLAAGKRRRRDKELFDKQNKSI